MKKIIEMTETKKVEVDIPAFFQVGDHYYMEKENGNYTQVFYHPIVEYLTDIKIVSESVAVKEGLIEITMDEFYSKLNEAFNILSIGSHTVEPTEIFSMDREQMIAESGQFDI